MSVLAPSPQPFDDPAGTWNRRFSESGYLFGTEPNGWLREQLNAAAARRGLRVHYPELALCTDNGAMIALAAALRLQGDPALAAFDYAFDVRPRWPLAEA